jgi:hypothetical protein
MDAQTDIVENEENPAAIPKRPLRPAELVELKILARTGKESLEAVYAGLATFNLSEDDQPFESTQIRFDDLGILLDDIIKYCSDELKKADLPKRRK